MKFNLRIILNDFQELDLCAKCHQPPSPLRPVLGMSVTGLPYNKKEVIEIHEDCLMQAIEETKKNL